MANKMTTATDFETQLDDNPADWTLRSIYADWLEERGDPRAESMRWMVEHKKCPKFYLHPGRVNTHKESVIPPSRIAAEIDLHNTLVKAGEITCALIEEVEA